MSDHQHLLMPHFEHIAERTDELGVLFYGKLEERHPTLMDSFGSQSKQRTQMLTQILAAVHDSVFVDDADWLALQLRALGRAHVDWKVASGMYGQVCACLVDALSELPDSGWTGELEQLWSTQLRVISELMHSPHAGRPA